MTDPGTRDFPVYDSALRDTPFLTEARELWGFRHLVRELASRDIKVRYKRSVLGIAWTMMSPLLNMAALTVVFSIILKQQIPAYPVYLLSGMIFWTFFAQVTTHATSLTADAADVTRTIHVPRSVFVVGGVCVGLVNLVLSFVPLLVIIAVTGHRIRAAWLFLPVPIAIGALFTLGVGLLVFTLASRFVDVRETYLVLLSPIFFITPIVYTPAMVPDDYRFLVLYNPMTYLIELFRAPLYDGVVPSASVLVHAAVAAVVSFAIGWSFFTAKSEEYAEQV